MDRRDFLSNIFNQQKRSNLESVENADLKTSNIPDLGRREFIERSATGVLTLANFTRFSALVGVLTQASCTKSCISSSTEYSFLGDYLDKGFNSKEEVQAKHDELKKIYDPIAKAIPVIAMFLNDYRSVGPALFDQTRPEFKIEEGTEWNNGEINFKDYLRYMTDKIITAFGFYQKKKDAFPERTLDLLWETQQLCSEFVKSISPEPQNIPDSRKGDGFERQWLKSEGNGHELLVNLEADLELIAMNLEYDLKQLENAKEDKDESDKIRWYPNGENIEYRDTETFNSSKRLDNKENWVKGFVGEGSFFDPYIDRSGSNTTRGLYRLGSHK